MATRKDTRDSRFSAAQYSDIGAHYEAERKAHADKASVARILMVVTTIVATFFDYQIYRPIADRIQYTTPGVNNLVVCLFLAAAPIAGAWILAELLVRIRIKLTRRSWHIPAFVLVLIFTVGLLVFTCWLRLTEAGGNAQDDQLVYAWTMNVLAILIAVLAFVVHLFLAVQHEKHKALAEKFELQRDQSEAGGEATHYCTTSESDRIREHDDYGSYLNTFDKLVDRALDVMDTARNEAAGLYASSPEQFRQVVGFPYHIGNTTYRSRDAAKAALLQLCGAPARGAQNHPYGRADQNALLDDEAREVVEALNERYRAIINDQTA